jgi:hypothetical protein
MLKRFFVIFCVLFIFNSCFHKEEDVGEEVLSLHECIYKSAKKKTKKFLLLKTLLTVNYVENNVKKSVNPYFPVIHITTNSDKTNAWLQVITTDAQDKSLKIFVDAVNEKKYPDIYPCYTLGNDFYDAPLWQYSSFDKPLSYWKAHAWAVCINKEKKTVCPIGGISWGFKLSSSYIHPICIAPEALEMDVWKEDWEIFKTKLEGFSVVEF